MTERPIVCRAWEVRAILEARKTQMRRIVKPQPYLCLSADEWKDRALSGVDSYMRPIGSAVREDLVASCPFGQPGDRLWVRETWGVHYECYLSDPDEPTFYRADYTAAELATVILPRWRPSIHMPRARSRITLEITDVRVERLQDISVADAIAEGCPGGEHGDRYAAVEQYHALWKSINGPDSWAANPWVWVLEFNRVKEPA